VSTAVFWDVTHFSIVGVYPHFKGSHCVHHQEDSRKHWNVVTRPPE